MIDINTQTEMNSSVLSEETHPIRLTKVWKGVGYDLKRTVETHLKTYLIEGKDYLWGVFADIGKNPKGGRPLKEYLLTPEAFKYLCITACTPQGRECFEYYLGLEKTAIARTRALLANTFTAAPVAPTRDSIVEYHFDEVARIIKFKSKVYLRSVCRESLRLGTDYRIEGKDWILNQGGVNLLAAICRPKEGIEYQSLPVDMVVPREGLIVAKEQPAKKNRRNGRRHYDCPGQLGLFED